MIARAARYTAGALRNVLVGLGALIFCGAVIATADYLFSVGAGTTMFAFTCFTTKVCPVHVNIDSTGAEISALNVGTVATPGTDVITTQQAIFFPAGSTAVTGNAIGTTGAVVGTLANAMAKTTYLCGFNVSAIGGTAAVGPITVAGLIGSSQVYELASAASGNQLSEYMFPCIPASAVNTPITITTTADASANAVAVNSWGYQQ